MKRTQQWSLHYFLYYLLAVGLMVTACKKGDTGPQGEKGDKGDTGATGATGANGSKGEAGTANVLYSPWLDLTFSRDQTAGVYFAQIDETRITDELLSTGEIKVYVNLGSAANKAISALPYTEGTAQIAAFLLDEMIEIHSNVNPSTVTDPATGNKFRQYRYVLIPGGAAVRKDKAINWDNYEEVKAYLGLKD